MICVLVISVAMKSVHSDDMVSHNEIMDSDFSGDQISYGKRNEIDNIAARPLENAYGPPAPAETSWLDSARTALSGPAGQIVVNMAKEMISRSTGNSQVFKIFLKLKFQKICRTKNCDICFSIRILSIYLFEISMNFQ